MNDPKIGATMRIDNHHAAGVSLPNRAKKLNAFSAKRNTGLVEARAMMITTNMGSVKLTPEM